MNRDRRLLVTSAAALLATLGLSSGLSASDPHGQPAKKPAESTPAATPKKPAKPASEHAPGKAEKPSTEHGEHAQQDETEDHSPAQVTMGDKTNGAKHAKPTDVPEEPAADDSAQAKPASAPRAPESAATDPERAIALLTEGNARWVAGSATSPNSDPSRRRETASGQNPFVSVITCADSRCPVERIFDRGVGDVFVARVAGNVIDANVAGTVEYGVEHLHTPLIVVMGHTSCGAVKAAVSGAKVGHNIDTLLAEIAPAVQRAQNANPQAEGDALLTNAIRENVYQSMFDLLKTSPLTAEMVSQGKVKLVGAVYDISSGKVEFLGSHPWQDQLIQAILKIESQGAQPASATASAEHDAH